MVCVYIGMKTISNVNLANYCQSSSFHLLVCLRKSIDAILAICKFVPGKIILFFMNIFTKDILFLYTKKKILYPVNLLFASVKVGSISSRFVRLRSFAHTTAGSLVCPIVFSTNQRLACTNRAGKFLIGQFSLVNNKDGGYL